LQADFTRNNRSRFFGFGANAAAAFSVWYGHCIIDRQFGTPNYVLNFLTDLPLRFCPILAVRFLAAPENPGKGSELVSEQEYIASTQSTSSILSENISTLEINKSQLYLVS
jgi:hypothetical protein